MSRNRDAQLCEATKSSCWICFLGRDPPIARKYMVIDFHNLAKMAWQDQAAEIAYPVLFSKEKDEPVISHAQDQAKSKHILYFFFFLSTKAKSAGQHSYSLTQFTSKDNWTEPEMLNLAKQY